MQAILSQGNIGVNEDCEVFNSPAAAKKFKNYRPLWIHNIKKYFPLFSLIAICQQ